MNISRSDPLRCLLLPLVLVALFCSPFAAADWPTFGGNAERTGRANEKLDFPLARAWQYTPAQGPRPAWPEPGKELHRNDFDYAPQPVIAGGIVYFGSSADDTLRALDLRTGTFKWTFTAGGPIRFAPAIAGENLYLACDDGVLHCLDPATGKLKWNFRGAPSGEQLLGNGRMISRWPCRSGVAARDGVVYFSAGMWPSHGIHVYALSPDGKEIWHNDTSGNMYIALPHNGASAFTGVAPQGYVAVSDEYLLIPTGRSVPGVYDAKTGRLRYYRPARSKFSGGWWTAIDGDIHFNARHRHVGDPNVRIGEQEPVWNDGMMFYRTGDGERGLEFPGRLCIVPAGDTLYAAGTKAVEAIDLAKFRTEADPPVKLDDCIRWSTAHDDRPYCMAGTAGAVLVGGRGTVAAFANKTGTKIWSSDVPGQARGLAVSDGRLVVATNEGKVIGFGPLKVSVPTIEVEDALEWDMGTMDVHRKLAADILKETGVRKGYAVVLGEKDSRLAACLAMQSGLHVVCALQDEQAVAAERSRLLSTNMYGTRIAVQHVPDFSRLPYAPYFADLVVIRNETGFHDDETTRIQRPNGGRLWLGGKVSTRGPLEGAGEWKYQWADGGNTGIGDETLVTPPFDLLWFGGPGPDRMMNRHWMAAAPLSLNGRVFVTGQNHVLAFDAYNGRELWVRELKRAARSYTTSSEGGNFSADDTSIYAAVDAVCYRFDQETGKTLTVYRLPEKLRGKKDPLSVPSGELDVDWPVTWRVFGPIPKDAALPDGRDLKKMPDRLTVGNRGYEGYDFTGPQGYLDLTYLYGGYDFEPMDPGETPGRYRGRGKRNDTLEGRMAYAFAEVTAPADGTITVGAAADWKMKWFLDGEPVYDTMEKGNGSVRFRPANHVFPIEVTKGTHGLAVIVSSGRQGWCLVSAGGARYLPHLKAIPPDRERPAWGYLSITDSSSPHRLVIGSCIGEGFANREASALFALDKPTGAARWIHRADISIPNNGIAFGDGKAFFLDCTPRTKVIEAGWSNRTIDTEQTLVAVGLDTGKELWRQEDVPAKRYRLQYARGIVVLDATAGYDGESGKKLWQKKVNPLKPPVIRGETIIAEPGRYHLRTGEPVMSRHLLTGEPRPWRFTRAYGCGPIGGCESFLFFRSGMVGFFDFAQGGTSTFGGIRPGCGISMVPANGLLIVPEASSGCSCSYSFQTSVALISSARRKHGWYLFEGGVSARPVSAIRANLGAPGDRRDGAKEPWLGYPRPAGRGASPLPVSVKLGDEKPYFLFPDDVRIEYTQNEWLYTSGARGSGTIEARLWATPVVLPLCETPPTIDGKLDDECWKNARPVPFPGDAHLLEPKAAFRFARDAGNIYLSYRVRAVVRGGAPLPFKAAHQGRTPDYHEDDCIQVLFIDGERNAAVYLALTCGGAYQAGLNLPREDKYDSKWNGDWRRTARMGPDEWTAEIAVPVETLKKAGINTANLGVNLKARNQSREGRRRLLLVGHGRSTFPRSKSMMPVVLKPEDTPERPFTVRLHFAEPENLRAGARVFDVRLQGKTVIDSLDIFKEAGGRNRALVREFKGVAAGDAVTVELISKSKDPGPSGLPLLNALEVLAE